MQELEASGSALPDDVVAKLVAARAVQVRRPVASLPNFCIVSEFRSLRAGRCGAQRLGTRRPAIISLPSGGSSICRHQTRGHHPPECSRHAHPSSFCPPFPSFLIPPPPDRLLLSDDVAEERCAGRVIDAHGRRWHSAAFPPPAGTAVGPLSRDAPESVRARLRAYAALAGAACDVDGGQAPLDVFRDVLKAAV